MSESTTSFAGWLLNPAIVVPVLDWHDNPPGPGSNPTEIAPGPGSPLAVFRLADHSDPARTVEAMLAVGLVQSDGEVTAGEAASLAVWLWPGLGADAGRVASVVSAIEHAKAGLGDDGRLSGEEVLEVVLDLLRALRDTIAISDLRAWAKWMIEGVVGRRKK